MNSELYNHILAEANTDWIAEWLSSGDAEDALCQFVQRMVVDALMDSNLRALYYYYE